MTSTIDIDARGHRCPMPVLKLRRALEEAGAGSTVRLLATDPVALKDVPAFCREIGAEITATGDSEDGFWFEVKA